MNEKEKVMVTDSQQLKCDNTETQKLPISSWNQYAINPTRHAILVVQKKVYFTQYT